MHPLVHLIVFGGIALLAAWGTDSPNVRAGLCAAIAALGCVTELVEWRLYANPLEYTDMVVDAIGAVVGTSVGAVTAPLLDAARHRRGLRETGQD
ncbi:hypothetical protein [Terriglobus aquaticus]|uniref:hypothetical protein n=1 Tax=Terriglobus aquaticus TaxID=940139 RepID=UPI0021E0EA93|nr:hypothetical protein [Terriglobus aquaticus]